ncbi:Cnl2/NKP2 family protein-domain-containing protein [Lasiosphaeria miniovina]|uniref:Cnl2/NKP2 family protein-domain-containing protein n=1 Tax=Lasiosphaeria miniovina TaxID=1954250 RepID=A0AA39ZZ79_9PEZI|nr:Cnl2/NKP2 family protein-domain-containing protein [Lasiosphaeria miniovina]KAK0706373.1 Cnl2/NKP2 family protein-domain-containing protein [Lasiosphaeria miniovina]
MAPSELKILSNYLLVPAQLPAVISLQEFTSLFPRSLQSSPHIRSLYRDVQSQRNALVDSVAAEIESEVKKGKVQRRTVIKERRLAQLDEQDDEIEIERMLFGAASNTQSSRHSINSILPELEGAIAEVENELQRLGEEEASLVASVRQTVGGMSDLRYGRLANSHLREQVLEGLADLKATCDGKN